MIDEHWKSVEGETVFVPSNMGCIWSPDAASETSKRIDETIKQEVDRKKDIKEAEILMIGNGHCGKSSLLKHIKTMFGIEEGNSAVHESDDNSSVKAQFSFKDIHYKVINWKGYLPSNRKLYHYFEKVMATIFIVGICDYDQLTDDDPPKNILRASLEQFESVCNDNYFEDSSLFLFLNKENLREEKLKTTALNVCFPEYSGAETVEEAASYIQSKFESLKKTDTDISTHMICTAEMTNDVTHAVIHVVMNIFEKTPRNWVDGLF